MNSARRKGGRKKKITSDLELGWGWKQSCGGRGEGEAFEEACCCWSRGTVNPLVVVYDIFSSSITYASSRFPTSRARLTHGIQVLTTLSPETNVSCGGGWLRVWKSPGWDGEGGVWPVQTTQGSHSESGPAVSLHNTLPLLGFSLSAHPCPAHKLWAGSSPRWAWGTLCWKEEQLPLSHVIIFVLFSLLGKGGDEVLSYSGSKMVGAGTSLSVLFCCLAAGTHRSEVPQKAPCHSSIESLPGDGNDAQNQAAETGSGMWTLRTGSWFQLWKRSPSLMVPKHTISSATMNWLLASSFLLLFSRSYPISDLQAGCEASERFSSLPM